MKKIKVITIFFLMLLGFNFILPLSKYIYVNQLTNEPKNPKLSNGSIIIQTPENKTYTQPMRGHYPATYGFESKETGTNPINWQIDDNGGSATIIDHYNGHEKVFHLKDNSTEGNIRVEQIFGELQSSGTIEFWIADSNATNSLVTLWLELLDSNDESKIRLVIDDNQLRYNNGTEQHVVINNFENNVWHHVKIDFNAVTDKCDIWADGIEVLTNENWYISGDNIRKIAFSTRMSLDYDIYLDALGYSWDPYYNEGDNLYEGLLLSYTTYFTPDWISYSLDGQSNKTILGNSTIPTPDRGIHTLQVYANDSIGSLYQSDIRFFSINYQSHLFGENFETITYESPQSNASGWGSGSISSEFKQLNIMDESSYQNVEYFELEKSGDYVYIISSDGLTVIDATNPGNLTSITEYDFITNIYSGGIDIEGNYAYLAAAENGLLIFDISNPLQPSLIGSIDVYRYGGYNVDIDLNPVDVVVSGNYAYVAGDDFTHHAVLAINVANPSAPEVVSICLYALGWWNAKLAHNGNFLYLSTYGIIDISNPNSIYPRGSFETGSGYPMDVVLTSNYAYVLRDYLYILDLNNPDDLYLAATCYVGGISIHRNNNYLYISTSVFPYPTIEIRVIDITNPVNPLLIYRSDCNHLFSSMRISENILYGTRYAFGFIVSVDLSNVGQYQLATIAESKTISSIGVDYIFKEFYLLVDQNLEGGTLIQYYLSVDNGIHWEEINPNIHYKIENKGNDLKWKAIFTTSNPYHKPTLNSLTIVYTYKKLLEAPNLIMPLNNSLININEPSFEWESVFGTIDYLIEIDTSSDFNSLNIHRYYSQNNFLFNIILSDGQWFYRIAANDSDGDLGFYSEIRNFGIDTVPPDIPILISPLNNTLTNDNFLTFRWTDIPDVRNYTLQFDTSPLFTSINFIEITDLPSNNFTTSLDDGTWYWKSCATDLAGNRGFFSEIHSVTIDSTPPDITTLMDPNDESFINTARPSFSWSSVSDAVNYTLQLDKSPSFLSMDLLELPGIRSESYRVSSDLSDGEWHWRVCAFDSAGNQGIYSNSFSLIVDTIIPIIDNPDDNSYTQGSTGNEIAWNGFDIHPDSYFITRDGVTIHNSPWDGSQIIINIDGLSAGEYIFNCTIFDKGGNFNSDIVSLKVDSTETGGVIPFELIILTSVIGVGTVIGVASILLIRRKRKNPK